MTKVLRYYQQEALECIGKERKNGVANQLIVLPTGTGKTVIISEFVKNSREKTLIIVNRGILINQMFNALLESGISHDDIGICRGKDNNIEKRIVIGTIQTCSKQNRLQLLKNQNFTCLIIDEAHHVVATIYKEVIKIFSCSEKLMIGVTATPERSDGKLLGSIFQKVVYQKSIEDMIREGFLSPVHGRKIKTGYTINDIGTEKDDFNNKRLSKEINTPSRNKIIVDTYNKYAHDRKAIVFCASVQHAKDMKDAFVKECFNAVVIHGGMSKKDQYNILQEFKNNKIQILISCELLTEGFDEPSISAVIIARPTKSKLLYSQMIGRGLRKSPGKEDCLVLDFSDNHNSLDQVVDLQKIISIAQYVSEETHNAEALIRQTKINREEIIQNDTALELIKQKRLLWVKIDGLSVLTADDNTDVIIFKFYDDMYGVFVLYTNGTRNDLAYRQSYNKCEIIAEQFARTQLKINLADTAAPWMQRKDPATYQQKQFLKRHGINTKNITKATASIKIREIKTRERYQKRRDE